MPAFSPMNPDLPQFNAAEHRGRFGWLDVVILAGIFGLFWSVLHFGGGMLVHFDEQSVVPLETGVWWCAV